MDSFPEKVIKTALLYTVTIFLGCSFVCWNFFLKPVISNLHAIETEKKNFGLKKAAVENIMSLKKKLSTYDGAFNTTQQLPWLIEESNRMAADSGLTLVSAAPGGDAVYDDYRKIALRIEARGGYHELGDFMSRVENSSRFIKVSGVNISAPVSDDDMKKGLHMWISLSIYIRKE